MKTNNRIRKQEERRSLAKREKRVRKLVGNSMITQS